MSNNKLHLPSEAEFISGILTNKLVRKDKIEFGKKMLHHCYV